ncbi:MAG: hypothetical protein AAF726_04310 [Planctomycetota bacterium]
MTLTIEPLYDLLLEAKAADRRVGEMVDMRFFGDDGERVLVLR